MSNTNALKDRDQTTRRIFLRNATAAAVAAVAVPAAAASPPSEEALIALIKKTTDLIPSFNALDLQLAEVGTEFTKRLGERPKALWWRVTDPVGYDKFARVKRDGKTFMLCDLEAVEELREQPQLQWMFTGTDEEAKLLADDSWDQQFRRPKNGFEHLWKGWPAKRYQKRADELVAALDAWRAREARIRGELDLVEIERKYDLLSDEIWDRYNQIRDTPTNSLSGLKAKLQFSLDWLGHEEIDCGGPSMFKRVLEEILTI